MAIWTKREAVKTPKKGYSPFIKLGMIRGIDKDDIYDFLYPNKSNKNFLHDPYLIKNIVQAVEKVANAVFSGKKICLSYDADADGITATTVLRRYLLNYTDNVDFIYNERGHGHGINEQIRIDFLNDNDFDDKGNIINEDKKYRYELNKENRKKIKESDILIIIDSSTNDTSACKFIKEEYETDILIIDHHRVERENKYATLVNPQQKNCKYPNKHLSGAGVVFKFIQVLEAKMADMGLSKVDVWDYLDLVAVGMYSDMMDVSVMENRYLIIEGLDFFNLRNVGLIRILKGANADLKKLNGDSIGFSVAPMINGVARLNKILLAIDIFMTDDENEAKKIRLKMHKLNEERKLIQKEIVERYMENIDESQKILVVSDDNSSKGVNGLVAQQLVSIYNRPTIVGRLHNGNLSGSFRSYNGFDLNNFLSKSNLFEEVAGHNEAGGISIKEENIDSLLEYIDNNMPELSNTDITHTYDLEIDVSEASEYLNAVDSFNRLTGTGFPKINLKINNITIHDIETIGKTKETRKFKTFDNIDLIKFKVNEEYASDVSIYDEINVIGELTLNEWFNFKTREKVSTMQVKLLDYEVV